MAKGAAHRDKQGGGKGQSRGTKRERGQFGNTRPREDKSVRRARGRKTDARYQAAVREVADHEAKLRRLEARLAAPPTEYVDLNDVELVDAVAVVEWPVRPPEPEPEQAAILEEIGMEARLRARDLLDQGYHITRVVALTRVPRSDLAHLVGRDGYIEEVMSE